MRKESGPQCPFNFKGAHRGSCISWGSLLMTMYKGEGKENKGKLKEKKIEGRRTY